MLGAIYVEFDPKEMERKRKTLYNDVCCDLCLLHTFRSIHAIGLSMKKIKKSGPMEAQGGQDV
jgi:hypothetical protein